MKKKNKDKKSFDKNSEGVNFNFMIRNQVISQTNL